MRRCPGPAWVSVYLFMISLGREACLGGGVAFVFTLSLQAWLGGPLTCWRCPSKPGQGLWGQLHGDGCWAPGPLCPPFATLRQSSRPRPTLSAHLLPQGHTLPGSVSPASSLRLGEAWTPQRGSL